MGCIDAYPTRSYVGPNSPEDLSPTLSPPTHQQLHTLYTSIAPQPFHPSRSSSLTIHPPKSSNPLTSSPLSLPFTLISICPHLIPDWSHLTSDLLTNILLLYPTGPTSSPYYTFSPASSSSSSPSSHDTYSITETVTLPTKTQDIEFRSTLHLSITPMTTAGMIGISKEEWRTLIGLLYSANGMMGAETHGLGFGRLEIGGNFPTQLQISKPKFKAGTKETKEKGEKRLGPSDIIFTSPPQKASRPQEENSGYPSPSPFTPSISMVQGEPETLFTWKATWVYYGVEIDGEGKEALRECSQMPLGTEIDFESRKGDLEKGAEGDSGEKVLKDVYMEDGEGEERWKIDL
ncbi:hypothetical protein EYC80_002913 [Monilinia laxa]|uniref:Uncharacterized protein n=1 Tax=Monilinia laxa TaxID=61186 RepID=A0A5N6KC26_MONLA|nr:hypothetical protein EYC80_002913 [Monilinia laxa]